MVYIIPAIGFLIGLGPGYHGAQREVWVVASPSWRGLPPWCG